MTSLVTLNAPYILNPNAKGLISDVHDILDLFFSWRSFRLLTFVIGLSFLFFSLFSSLIPAEASYMTLRPFTCSSPTSNLSSCDSCHPVTDSCDWFLSYCDSCSLRYHYINFSCFFLSCDVLFCQPMMYWPTIRTTPPSWCWIWIQGKRPFYTWNGWMISLFWNPR